MDFGFGFLTSAYDHCRFLDNELNSVAHFPFLQNGWGRIVRIKWIMLVKACNTVKAHNKLSLNMIIKTTFTTFETITIITFTVTTYKPRLCHSSYKCKVFTDFQRRTWCTKIAISTRVKTTPFGKWEW